MREKIKRKKSCQHQTWGTFCLARCMEMEGTPWDSNAIRWLCMHHPKSADKVMCAHLNCTANNFLILNNILYHLKHQIDPNIIKRLYTHRLKRAWIKQCAPTWNTRTNNFLILNDILYHLKHQIDSNVIGRLCMYHPKSVGKAMCTTWTARAIYF